MIRFLMVFALLATPALAQCPNGRCPTVVRQVAPVPVISRSVMRVAPTRSVLRTRTVFYATPAYVAPSVTYASRGNHWTYPGDLATHLMSTHGAGVAGLSREDMLNLHDSLHESERVTVRRRTVVNRPRGLFWRFRR